MERARRGEHVPSIDGLKATTTPASLKKSCMVSLGIEFFGLGSSRKLLPRDQTRKLLAER
jgi:hypothetical protein